MIQDHPITTQTPQPTSWANEFYAFSSFHALVLAICVSIFIATCITGKILLRSDDPLSSGTRSEKRFRTLFAYSILISQAFFFIRRLTPEQWDIQDSLPLHLCRWVVWISAWAMLTLNPKMRALLLFWGIGLSTQAFFSPMITYGYLDFAFWIYWINHVQIVGAGIYDIVVLGYRPSFKDLRFAMLSGLVYALITITLNAVLNTNYSYLGNGQHTQSSIVDQLGPYPQRMIWMILGALILFIMIYGCSKLMIWFRVRVLKKSAPRRIDPTD